MIFIIVASETFSGPPLPIATLVDVITAHEVDVTQTGVPFRALPYMEMSTAALHPPSGYQREGRVTSAGRPPQGYNEAWCCPPTGW